MRRFLGPLGLLLPGVLPLDLVGELGAPGRRCCELFLVGDFGFGLDLGLASPLVLLRLGDDAAAFFGRGFLTRRTLRPCSLIYTSPGAGRRGFIAGSTTSTTK